MVPQESNNKRQIEHDISCNLFNSKVWKETEKNCQMASNFLSHEHMHDKKQSLFNFCW